MRGKGRGEQHACTADDDDRYQAYLNLGIIEMREGRTEEGLAMFERASVARPKETEAWLYQSRVLAQTGRAREAELRLDQARRAGVPPAELDVALNQLRSTGTLP